MKRHLPTDEKSLPLLGAVIAALLIGGLALALLNDADPKRSERTGSSRGAEEPDVPQAEWELETFAAGTAGAPSKSDKRAVASEREGLIRAVTRVADALVLDPDSLAELTGEHLAPAAAKALRRSGLVLPEGMTEVRTIVRKASIGLDSNGAVRAAARIKLVAEAANEGRPVRFVQEANLFLKRSSGKWLVVAFDGELKPRKPEGGKS